MCSFWKIFLDNKKSQASGKNGSFISFSAFFVYLFNKGSIRNVGKWHYHVHPQGIESFWLSVPWSGSATLLDFSGDGAVYGFHEIFFWYLTNVYILCLWSRWELSTPREMPVSLKIQAFLFPPLWILLEATSRSRLCCAFLVVPVLVLFSLEVLDSFW